jgi:enamine deaminase RidA (YjgF/YER057c/UK114 family)
MKSLPIGFLTGLMALVPLAAAADIVIKRWNPDGLHKPTGYSQVVTVEGSGRHIYLSGMTGSREDRTFPKTLAEQSKVTFEKIRTALAAAGATPADVVDVEIFIVDLANADARPVYDDVAAFFPQGHKPASMVIGVSALARPGLLLEVKVTAVVGK